MAALNGKYFLDIDYILQVCIVHKSMDYDLKSLWCDIPTYYTCSVNSSTKTTQRRQYYTENTKWSEH